MLSDGTFESLPVKSVEANYGKNMPLTAKAPKDLVPFEKVGSDCTLDEFIAQMSDDELCEFMGGSAPTGVCNTSAFSGMKRVGVPDIPTADGPAGLRLNEECGISTTAFPCATLLACTWDPELVEEVGIAGAKEVKENNLAVWLTPGLNIHRHPLCGRNFEYFSEDPLISGKMATAMVQGIQKNGIAATVKHFACNNKEINRFQSDSRVSERALREIYLKGFEICVKESSPENLMTSYNKINGVWSHYNYDLATTILREEWGYKGNIVTDWWMRKAAMPEFPKIKNNAYRVRAQVDVLMPGGESYSKQKYAFDKAQLATLDQPDGLTRAELQRTAMNVLRFAMTRI